MNNRYLFFKGKHYDVGTKVLIKTRWNGIQEATFYGWGTYPFRGENVWGIDYYYFNIDKYLVDIIEPIEVNLQPVNVDDKNCPPAWDVEIGWIWYILIMAVGLIFKDFWMIWIVATIIFFSWKKGFLGGKK